MIARRAIFAFLILAFASHSALHQSPKPGGGAAEPGEKQDSSGDAVERAAVRRWLASMTLRDKIAQLIVIHSYGETPAARSKEYNHLIHAVRDLGVGGIIVVNRVVNGSVRSAQPVAMASFLNRMQRFARVPLLAAADFERGASMRVSGTARFPHLMAYGAANDQALTRQLGAATAREARAMGIHWVFAPDADVNNNPDNPIINIRSFGEDPHLVARHVEAFIRGSQSDPANRVLVTAKHFPGHGDTSVDSHAGLASLEASRDRMNSVELIPFRAAVNAGVDSIMTAHMAVPAWEAEQIPATVSRRVLTDLLRKEVGFEGIIVTDAMDMQGLTKQFPPGAAAVRALQAGADVLLMPPDPDAAIRAVLGAIREGRLTQKRIDQSVERVLASKARVGLHRGKLVNVAAILATIEAEDLAVAAQTAADRAVTLVENERGSVPLRSPDSSCLWVLHESRNGIAGRRFTHEYRVRASRAHVNTLNPQMTAADFEALVAGATGCETHVVATFVTAGAFRGGVSLRGNYPQLLRTLQEGAVPVVLVSLGNPYLLRDFPNVSSYIAAYSPVQTAEVAAVRALFGELAIRGRLPVSIPGIAAVGQGIELPPL